MFRLLFASTLRKEVTMSDVLPRGLRNCNPGNIRLGSTVWVGEIRPSQDKQFCQFTSMAYGYRALIKLLQNYRRRHGCQTIADMINRWAPSTENNTSAYIRSVCQELQAPSTCVIDVDDRDSMCALAAAISKHENGVDAVMDDILNAWNLL